MYKKEDYLLQQITLFTQALAKLIALIKAKQFDDAQEMIMQNINTEIQNGLLQNDEHLLTNTNKQVLEFQIELAYQRIIILDLIDDENLKIKVSECLIMIKNYNNLNSSVFNFELNNKIKNLERLTL